MSKLPLKRIAITGMFAALSLVFLAYIPRFPLFLPFLEYDFADVPIIILTMLYGPVYGLIVTVVVCLFQGFLLSASGYLGVLMHIVATGSFVIVFGLLNSRLRGLKGAIVSAIAGVLTWTSVMILFNILITPIFMGVAREAVYPLLLPAIIPFNLIKSGGNSAIAIALYFALDRFTKGVLSRESSVCKSKKLRNT